MEKPKIEVRHAEGFKSMPKHFFLNGKALTLDQIESRYSKMIYALMQAYLLIDDMPIDDRKERHLMVYNKIADALEKAGVKP